MANDGDNDQGNSVSSLSQALKFIPEYSGETAELYEFIEAVELIISEYYVLNNPDSFQNQLLFIGIKNRLKGAAKTLISSRRIETWEAIKNTLKGSFADTRNTASLINSLGKMYQKGNESARQFGGRISEQIAIINQQLALENNGDEVLHAKQNLIAEQGLKTFLAGLTDPLSQILRARQPTDMADAISFIIEEENINQMRRSQDQLRNNPQINQNNQRKFNNPFNQPRNNPFNNNQRFQPPSKFCNYCKKPGHLINECRSRNFNNQRIPHQNNTPNFNPNFNQRNNSYQNSNSWQNQREIKSEPGTSGGFQNNRNYQTNQPPRNNYHNPNSNQNNPNQSNKNFNHLNYQEELNQGQVNPSQFSNVPSNPTNSTNQSIQNQSQAYQQA